MTGDDAPYDIQPEPGPGPDVLCGVERLEDVDLRLARYPTPVVNDLHHHAVAFYVRPDSDASASVHSVNGVVDEVGPYLVQLAAAPGIPGRSFSYSLDKETSFSLGPRMVMVFWRPEITSTSPTTALSM